jgi:tetratricopeptide (TPR) repeat protein
MKRRDFIKSAGPESMKVKGLYITLGLVMLTILQTACRRETSTSSSAPKEIPITTKSEEARKIFLEARDKFDNLRTDEAREFFSTAIEKDSDFAIAHLNRAFVATSATDFENHLQQAMALAPKASEGERLLIEATHANIAERNPIKGIGLLEQLIQKFPNDKRAHNTLGYVYGFRDEDDKAIAEFNKAIEIDKDFAPIYNGLGYAYSEKGDYAKAEEAFKNYVRLLPNEANPHDSFADLYTKMDRYEDAIEHYKKAVELNPKFSMSQQKIGTNLVFMGKFNEGREAYQKALEMETTPAGKVAEVQMMAYSYVHQGKYQEALSELDRGSKMAAEAGLPELEAAIHNQKWRLYTETRNFDKAERSLAACMKVVEGSSLMPSTKEEFARGALLEALATAKRKDFKTAKAKAEEYKGRLEQGKDPKEMRNYHALAGFIDFEKGDYTQAIEHFKQANQEDPNMFYYFALAGSKAGEKAKAAELFKKVADWNQNSLDYALVRTKAKMTLERKKAEKK